MKQNNMKRVDENKNPLPDNFKNNVENIEIERILFDIMSLSNAYDEDEDDEIREL